MEYFPQSENPERTFIQYIMDKISEQSEFHKYNSPTILFPQGSNIFYETPEELEEKAEDEADKLFDKGKSIFDFLLKSRAGINPNTSNIEYELLNKVKTSFEINTVKWTFKVVAFHPNRYDVMFMIDQICYDNKPLLINYTYTPKTGLILHQRVARIEECAEIINQEQLPTFLLNEFSLPILLNPIELIISDLNYGGVIIPHRIMTIEEIKEYMLKLEDLTDLNCANRIYEIRNIWYLKDNYENTVGQTLIIKDVYEGNVLSIIISFPLPIIENDELIGYTLCECICTENYFSSDFPNASLSFRGLLHGKRYFEDRDISQK